MKSILKLIRKFVPEYAIIPLVCLILLQLVAYSGTKLIMGGAYHYNLETEWDLRIPFLPWTVLIYVGAFLYWVIAILVIVRSSKELAFRFLCADALGKLVSMVFFILLPTTNTRPPIEGHTLWDFGMQVIHFFDDADNLFPSMHCLMSWMCAIALAKDPKVPKIAKAASYIFSLMIFAATLTTKQHIIYDVIGGCLLAEICYRLCRFQKVTNWYYKLFDREFRFLKV